jgi:hypothetical protein
MWMAGPTAHKVPSPLQPSLDPSTRSNPSSQVTNIITIKTLKMMAKTRDM